MWVQSRDYKDPLEEENGHQLQYSCLTNPMDSGAELGIHLTELKFYLCSWVYPENMMTYYESTRINPEILSELRAIDSWVLFPCLRNLKHKCFRPISYPQLAAKLGFSSWV